MLLRYKLKNTNLDSISSRVTKKINWSHLYAWEDKVTVSATQVLFDLTFLSQKHRVIRFKKKKQENLNRV